MTDLDGLEVDSAESPLEQAIGREAVERYEQALAHLSAEEREAPSLVQIRAAPPILSCCSSTTCNL
jgi:DNA-directed RNA polymerase specialized sigma24 family protein